MLIPTPLPRASTTKNLWEQNHSPLKTHPLPSSTHYGSSGTNYSSFLKKKYRNHSFTYPPEPQELNVYLGWTTGDVISEMRDLGYNVSLNIPQNIMSFDIGFGRLNFHFDSKNSMIEAVKFQPKT